MNMPIRNHRFFVPIVFGVILLFAAMWVSACEPMPTPPPLGKAAPSPTPKPTATLVPVQLTVQQVYTTSKHANTYEPESNINECARCHAPMNWIPTAPEDMPATCAACKFTVKTPKPVEKANWKSIGCEQCHKVEKDTLLKQVAWLNAAIAQFDPSGNPYEAVKSNTELCEKCHRDTYKIDMGKSAHAGKGCTDCHDAHSTKASCTDAKCHANALKPDKPIAGHDAAHAAVPCATCHDASGMKVAPTSDKKTWLTYQPKDPRGKAGDYAVVSHNVKKQVECARCHSANNPWGLKPQ